MEAHDLIGTSEEMRADPDLRVSVVVPVAGPGDAFQRCLAAIAACDPAPDEVVVVIDGRDRGEREMAAGTATHVVETGRQRGPAAARNAGARHASGEVLFFVDADVAVHPDTVGVVRTELGRLPDVDAVIGSYDDAPPAPGFLSQYKNLVNHFVHQHASPEGSTFWGACGAIRRRTFNALGGFDESYTEPCIEDIELGYRLRGEGGRIRVLPHLQATHLKRWRAAALVHADVFRRGVPWSELILRTGRMANDLNVSVAGRVKVGAAWGTVLTAAGARSRPRALAAAMVLAGVVAALDLPLLRFLARKRGLPFALAAMPWQFAYHLYSGISFGLALGRHGVRQRTGRQDQRRGSTADGVRPRRGVAGRAR